MHKEDISDFPRQPGIYKFLNKKGMAIYIGKALSLKDRVLSYFASDATSRIKLLLSETDRIEFVVTGSEFEALLLEARLIKLFKPKYNVVLKDDKSYLYIFISSKEEFPKIYLTRKPKSFLLAAGSASKILEGEMGEYFGPFPSANTARAVMKFLRRIFPYCQQKKLGHRSCFYSHIGLCDPCPSRIYKLAEPTRSRMKNIYRRNIYSIKSILDGNISKLKHTLEKEMAILSKDEQFEEAAKVNRQLLQLEYIAMGKDTTAAFLENENFHFDRQKLATENLRSILLIYFPTITTLSRIECYDISNLQGKFAVGAETVFINGIAETSQYRRYKIKTINSPNDSGMLAEILRRRLAHLDWAMPDLIVVDGGKSQVSSAAKTLTELNITIPVVGLAKRLEYIVLWSAGNFIEIKLSRRDNALKFLQQMRDETHRFVISYHKTYRAKAFLK